MLTHEVRHHFLEYFRHHGHAILPSSPVIPHDDPSLLFANAGMNQFKDVFLGKAASEYRRAVTSQKCIRAGGKHNDLENVGHTRRHLTFFEMLGNFSFGDYFKEQAIQFAWEVSTEVFGLDPKRIWASVFVSDDEAFSLWKRYLPEGRIVRMGAEENFWAMGDTGPCGPCSELIYDSGAAYGKASSPLEDPTGNRYFEFWNLVFMQYNRNQGGTEEELPKPSIDTGAGLERVMCLIQNKENVFESDILRSLINAVEEISGVCYEAHDERIAPAFHVISDHLRALAFAIADGAQPSNIERGYVLRKILRRAVRYGRTLGFDAPFLARLLPRLIEVMGKDYRELIVARARIEEILTREEESFLRTLRRGGAILNRIIETSIQHHKVLSGDDAFTLKDTYGLPLDEMQLLAKDYDLAIDVARFEELERFAKAKSRAARGVHAEQVEANLFEELLHQFGPSRFVRSERPECSARITAIVHEGKIVQTLPPGVEGMIILNETPFYAEMGGQVGDTGELVARGYRVNVTNCLAPFKGVIAHIGSSPDGIVKVGDEVQATVDWARRQKIARNHTATHLLHWALHQVLGEHARQAGSVVDEQRLRFDVHHHKAIAEEEIRTIEYLVNDKIRENVLVRTYEIPYAEARGRPEIQQFFGDKYGEIVRVVDIDFSKELCGGTHVGCTGTIGYFRILKETSIAAGTRRIEAVTGVEAEHMAYASDDLVGALAKKLKVPSTKLSERLDKLLEEHKQLEHERKGHLQAKIESMARTLAHTTAPKGYVQIAQEVLLRPDELRALGDALSKQFPSVVFFLACQDQGKTHVLIRASRDLIEQGIRADALLKEIMPLVQGAGGGRPESAQGVGVRYEGLNQAIAHFSSLLP